MQIELLHPTSSKAGRRLFAPLIWLCRFLGNHTPGLLLRIRYFIVFRKPLNLKNPHDLNQKILWAKLYSDTSEWTRLADKYEVRKYIEGKGLGDTLVKLYAVWYRKEDVDFDALPETFIIKANNGDGKGTNKIVRKAELTPEKKMEYINVIDEWLHRKNIGALSAEPQYKGMRPCVTAEEVLQLQEGDNSLTDYKIWCFNGKAYYIWTCNNRSANGNHAHVMTYDTEWTAHPEYSASDSHYPLDKIIPKPENLDQMIAIAEKLSQGFPQLRVDLYNVKGKIYFGELTFTSQGGLMCYFTPEFNKMLGDKFSINDFPMP